MTAARPVVGGPPDPWPPLPLPGGNLVEDVRNSLVLRTWQDGDAADLASAWAEPSLRRWTAPPSGGVESAERWIAGEARRRAEGIALDLVVELSGRLCGEVALSQFDQRPGTAVVGYWVAPSARGRGLAATAVGLTLEWAASRLGLEAALARTDAANVASVRTLERAGFEMLLDEGVSGLVYAWRAPGFGGYRARGEGRA